MNKLSVLMASAECTPFAKVGGLADVIGSLPQALHKKGIKASVIMPKYQAIPKKFNLKQIAKNVKLDFGRHKYEVTVYHTKLPGNPVDYYFIDHRLFHVSKIYGYGGKNAKDTIRNLSDIDRFTLFSEAVVETIHHLKLDVDVLHCHDWQAAFIPTSIDQLAVAKNYPFTKTLLTIHNLAYQGKAPRTVYNLLDLKPTNTPSVMEDYYDRDKYQLNLLKLGILSADKINTVSPTYAKEIQQSEFGAKMESYLIRRHKDVNGILNGLDMNAFNPAKDPLIYKRYSPSAWKKNKAYNKMRLQKEVGLPVSEIPLYSLVNRLVHQKGPHLLIGAMKRMLKHDIQFVLLGTGFKKFENDFKKLALQYPNKVAAIIDFDNKLARRIYAGGDFFLLPSHYEPCGLGQMIAMRYGNIPIVRATGGLKDTVKHGKTGIVFQQFTVGALHQALEISRNLYENKKSWYTMVNRIMREDFSWGKSALEYIKLYNLLAR